MHTKAPENVRESIVTGNGSVVVINPWGWGALGRSRGTAEGTRRRGAVGLSTVWMVVSLTSAYVCGRFSNRMLLCAVYSLSIILD